MSNVTAAAEKLIAPPGPVNCSIHTGNMVFAVTTSHNFWGPLAEPDSAVIETLPRGADVDTLVSHRSNLG